MNRPVFQGRSAHGFSLVELVLACAILAMLLVASRSAVYLAAKAGQSVPAQRTVELSSALSDLSADLACATSISSLSASSIGVVVPDRDGDGNADAITYSWSGVPGDPLVRTTNGGSGETLVGSMRAFSVAGACQTVTVAGVGVKNSERLLGGNSTTSGLKNNSIKNDNYRAGSFVPSNLPANATSWDLTRVSIMVRQKSSIDGTFAVQVQTTNAQAPSGRVLGQVVVAESSLASNYAWKDIVFTDISNLSVTNPLAVVVKHVSGNEACELQSTGSGGAMIAGNACFKSTDQGASWSSMNEELIFVVYGIPNVPAPTATASAVTSIQVLAESVPGIVMHINVPTSNVPQME